LFVACAVLLAVGLAARWHALEPRHSSDQIKAVAAAVADWKYPPADFSRMEYEGERFFQRAGGAPGRVLFIGDSITEQYAIRVDRLLSEQRERTKSSIFAATGGCPPIPGVVLERAKECQPRLDAATALALSADVDTVVIGACWYCYFHAEGPVSPADEYRVTDVRGHVWGTTSVTGADLALQSFERLLRTLVARKKVYVILSSPSGDAVNPSRLLRGSRFGQMRYEEGANGVTLAEFSVAFGTFNERLRALAVAAGASVIDPLPALCPNGRCAALDQKGDPIYADGVHIRASYVRHHASYIDPVVQPAP
jgi:hypothetical protein